MYLADPAGAPRGALVDRAGDLRGQQPHPRGVRRLCGTGLRRDRAGAVRPGRARRRARLRPRRHHPRPRASARGSRSRMRSPTSRRRPRRSRARARSASSATAGAGRSRGSPRRARETFAAAVSYYGGGVPDLADEQPNCPVQLHFGEQDQPIPLAGVEKLQGRAPGPPGLHLPGRARLQLRPARLLPRRERAPGARAHARVPARAHRLTSAAAERAGNDGRNRRRSSGDAPGRAPPTPTLMIPTSGLRFERACAGAVAAGPGADADRRRMPGSSTLRINGTRASA